MAIDAKFFRSVVGARIRYLRTLRGMEQRELGEKAGIVPSKLCKIEKGTHGIDSADAVRVSEALQVSLDELLAVPGDSEHAAK